jgi:Cu+-exporting ATPase
MLPRDGAGIDANQSLERTTMPNVHNNSAESAPGGPIFICPMHPEIRRPAPGNCPICGMTLEPELPADAEAGPSAELVDMTRRFWIGAALSAPVVVLENLTHLGQIDIGLSRSDILWLQLSLATPAVLWAGWPFFIRAWHSLRTRMPNMFTLIAMGTGIAWLYSVVAVSVPDIFPAAFRDADGRVAVYFEAAAVITVLVLLGQVLELRARERTSGAIRALLDLAPKLARRVTERGGRGTGSSPGTGRWFRLADRQGSGRNG